MVNLPGQNLYPAFYVGICRNKLVIDISPDASYRYSVTFAPVFAAAAAAVKQHLRF